MLLSTADQESIPPNQRVPDIFQGESDCRLQTPVTQLDVTFEYLGSEPHFMLAELSVLNDRIEPFERIGGTTEWQQVPLRWKFTVGLESIWFPTRNVPGTGVEWYYVPLGKFWLYQDRVTSIEPVDNVHRHQAACVFGPTGPNDDNIWPDGDLGDSDLGLLAVLFALADDRCIDENGGSAGDRR